MSDLFGPGGLFSWRRTRPIVPPPAPAPVPLYQDPAGWAPQMPRETALYLQQKAIREEVERVAATGVRDDPDVNRAIEAMYRRLGKIRAELDT